MFEAMKKRCFPSDAVQHEATGAGPCCAPAASAHPDARAQDRADQPKLEDLVPIAVVIAAGCEGCAERMVRRAVEAGSAVRHIRRTLAIAADLTERECFRTNIPPEVVERMKAPLAAARKTLEALTGSGAGAG